MLLLGVAIPVWADAVDHFPAAKDSTVVYVMGQQYAWNVRYAGRDGVFGRQDMKYVSEGNVFGVDPTDPNGKDDLQLLNDIHVPINKPVIVYVSSKDVILFVQDRRDARLPGCHSRIAHSLLVHPHAGRALLRRSIARSSAWSGPFRDDASGDGHGGEPGGL